MELKRYQNFLLSLVQGDINRTRMELKLGNHPTQKNLLIHINRTRMELKRKKTFFAFRTRVYINRTRMELKPRCGG